MKDLKNGTPAFGFLIGILFAVIGLLLITLGFWKTLLLCVLFGVGYFLGAVNNKGDFVKNTVNRIIPEKKPETIDFRKSLTREQEEAYKFTSEYGAKTDAVDSEVSESAEGEHTFRNEMKTESGSYDTHEEVNSDNSNSGDRYVPQIEYKYVSETETADVSENVSNEIPEKGIPEMPDTGDSTGNQ